MKQFTWAQFTGYLRSARRRAALERMNRIVDTNAAFAGGDAALKLHKGLADMANNADA